MSHPGEHHPQTWGLTLVLVNTRLVDRVLDDPDFAGRLTANDLRGLTPLFWSNVALHGTFELDLDTRIDYSHRGWVISSGSD